MVFSPPSPSNGACALVYNNSTSQLSIFKQDGSGLIGPITPGSTSTITNGACSVTGLTVAGTGNQLTVTVPMTFTAPFRGNTAISMVAYSQSGLSSSARVLGSYNINSLINSPPTVDSVTPSSGSGISPTFSFQSSDPNGYQDLGTEYMVFSPPSPSNGACALVYNNSTSQLSIFKQDGSGLIGPITPGSTSTITNGACSVTGLTVTGTGNQLTVTVPMTFTAPFRGNTAVSMVAYSQSGLSSGARTLGSYNITP
jgi:trimeric autotransporter adhesin